MTTAPAGGPWGAVAVGFTYKGTRALDDVSLPATPGVVTAVVGGDGAGKSTLLRCLAGALAPDSGTVAGPGPMATGYLPASSGTYPDLTVAENLAFRASAYGLRGRLAAERAAGLIERAGLADARDRLAGQLSGGMRQKLGVIAAMLHRPALLVLDEPTTGVDPVSRSGLWLLITTAAAAGAAVVLSTTYSDDAQRAGWVLALDAGHVLAAGTPGQIVAGMPGSVLAAAAAPAGPAGRLAWRRGGGWRIWRPPRGTPGSEVPAAGGQAAGEPVPADLGDAVTVAALRQELSAGPDAAGPARGAAAHSAAAARGPQSAAPPLGTAAVRPPGSAAPPLGTAAVRPPGSAAPPLGKDAAHLPATLAECSGVTCRFGKVSAVRGVSVAIHPGEVVGLLGANGAGKTTLIRMLLGLQRPTAGWVRLLGEPPSRRTRQRIGYVPQGLGLYDDLTAAQNMQFAARVFGSGRAELPDDVARLAGVPVGALPLGLQRRTAFAQALSHGPGLLILDEPTSGVDPLGRARLWDMIAGVAASGGGVLVSTHYMEEAWECDRLVIMADGEVVATGTADQVIGAAQVTVAEADDWAGAFGRLAAAGLTAALAGRELRVPRASVAEVSAALAGLPARVSRARATLEERFFELADAGAQPSRRVPA